MQKNVHSEIKRKKHRWPSNIYPPGPDSAVITLMTKYKANTSKSRPIVFYLYFPTKTAALKAKSELLLKGYSLELFKSSYDSTWVCLATITMQPNLNQLLVLRSYFDRLADNFNGTFDGWETELIF